MGEQAMLHLVLQYLPLGLVFAAVVRVHDRNATIVLGPEGQAGVHKQSSGKAAHQLGSKPREMATGPSGVRAWSLAA